MTCICGYTYYCDGSAENVAKGDTEDVEFIRLNLVATIKRGWDGEESVTIYACPACHTLQVGF